MQGKASTGWLVAIMVVFIVLVSTNVWNPFPAIWDWVNTSRPIADPAAYWQQRLGGAPQAATLVDDYVIVEQRESVEVLSRISGRQLWRAEADWAAVAGTSGRTVIVTGELLSKGYTVLSPLTGAVLRRDETAAAVWSFSDALLDIGCRSSRDCVLTAREPAGGEELWQVPLPGYGFVLFADNPELPGTVPIGADRIKARVDPAPMPPLLGFPISGQIHVVNTATGSVLPTVSPARNDMVIVAGGRVLHSIAQPTSGGCANSITGADAVSGGQVWHWDNYHLRTISGAGCEQRNQPAGGGSTLVAVRQDGREVLLGARDGRELLVCAEGESIVATDGVYAVVRAKDGATIRAYAVGKKKPLWTREVGDAASVAVVRTVVVLTERDPDRVLVLDAKTGRAVADVASGADVLALDEAGMLLNERRELAYVPFAPTPAASVSPAPSGRTLP